MRWLALPVRAWGTARGVATRATPAYSLASSGSVALSSWAPSRPSSPGISTVHSGGRLDQHMQRQVGGTGGDQGGLGAVHIGHGLDLGHHDVGEDMSGAARNVGHVGVKTGVVHGVDTNGNAGGNQGVRARGGRGECHFCDQCSVFGFATDGCAVFAVQGDIEDASAELLRHVGLQLQAVDVVGRGDEHAALVRAQRAREQQRGAAAPPDNCLPAATAMSRPTASASSIGPIGMPNASIASSMVSGLIPSSTARIASSM